MFGSYWMNVWSPLFGVAAWGLGLAALLLRRKDGSARWCSIGSLTACVFSLCLEIFNFARLADIEDVIAFLDTAGGVRVCAGILVLGTLALNAAALIVRPAERGAA